MKLNLAPLTIEQFLADYWQQKPVIIKGGIVDFNNPLEADELAGLAAEAHIESRLISLQNNTWHAESGPFADYDTYGDKNWTLVVQSVNHWIPAVQDFAKLFDFIPQWRFDDVMVSFAAPGGGVGPHMDNYDVFICQGSGQRRWQVGHKNAVKEVIAHKKLLHVKAFTAIIDEIVSPGDILYIPPGFPHEGISLDQSMSFSVGYKATNATELLSGFADYLIDFDKSPALLSDKQRQQSLYGQINAGDFTCLQQFLQQTLNDKNQLADFFGIYYSQSFSELDLAQHAYDFTTWLSIFANTPLQKLYAVKTLYVEHTINQGIFYVDGERHQLDVSPELIRTLCDNAQLTMDEIITHKNNEAANNEAANNEVILHWLWQSTQRGYWYFA